MVEVWDTLLAEVGSQGEAALREATFSITRSSGKRKQEEGPAEGRALVTTDVPCELQAPSNENSMYSQSPDILTHQLGRSPLFDH